MQMCIRDRRFEDVLFSDYGREDFMVQEDYDASIGVEDIGLALSGDLALLEPFGLSLIHISMCIRDRNGPSIFRTT